MRVEIVDEPKIYSKGVLDSFLGPLPFAAHSADEARNLLENRSFPREELASILRGYNLEIGHDGSTLQQIDKIKDPTSVCVVTGQQLGLMTGPMYTIMKAVTCLQVAQEYNAIPIFWIESEDHDIAEIDHTYYQDLKGNIHRSKLSYSYDHRMVEDLKLTSEHIQEIDSFLSSLGLSYPLPEEGERFMTAMARLLANLFKGTGLVLLEPYLLRPLSKNFIKRELTEADRFEKALQTTSEKMSSHRIAPPVDTGNSPHLFLNNKEGKRYRVNFKENSLETLLEIADTSPERFSFDVVSRAAFQTEILPTLGYVAGPTEITYLAQFQDYFKAHELETPWIIPRLSATLISSEAQKILKTPISKLSEDHKKSGEEWKEKAQESARTLFDHTLPETWLDKELERESNRLINKSIKTVLQNEGIPSHAMHLINNLLHPHDQLQERVYNFMFFQSQTDEPLIPALLKQLSWKTEGHHYLYLSP